MPYLIDKKTKDQLIQAAVEDVIALSGLDEVLLNTTLDATLRSVTNRLSEFYDTLETNFNAAYLSTASGPYLDYLAADRSIIRSVTPTTYIACASETLKYRTIGGESLYSALNIDPLIKYAVIPRGTVVTSSTDPSLHFEVEETVIISPSASSVSIGVSGILSSGITIPTGTLDTLSLTTPIFDNADFTKVRLVQAKNIFAIETVESDASLRVRISQHLQTFATSNTVAVTGSILSHPDVSAVYVNRRVRGTGSFDIVVYPRRNRISKSVINEFQSALNAAVSYGEDARVIPPSYIPLSISVSSSSSSSQSIVRAIEEFVETSSNNSMSYSILKSFLRAKGIELDILRISVSYRDILPATVITLLPTEIFELRPRIGSEQAIEVV